jgi:hypothetical protein
MDLSISIEGEGPDAVKEISGLRDWLHEARLRDVKSVVQQKQAPKPGELGPELLQVLEVVLAAPTALGLVRCIRAYIDACRPTMIITFKTKSGTLKIEARNPPPTEELERMAKTLMPG